MNKYPDYPLVQKCLQEIETQLGWGTSDEWHSDVFQELSEQIQNQTEVLLSPTTLKRIWGKVRYANAPSINTLNTLAQFAGYANWRDFKVSSQQPPAQKESKKAIPNLGIIISSAAILSLLFISFFSITTSTKPEANPVNLSGLQFSSRPIAEGLPNSVVFDFDLQGIPSDSIYIQQFWDPTKTIKLQKGQDQATGIYYFPGYFRAKLLVDGEIIKEHDLFIKSNDWMATLDYEPVPKYIGAAEILQDKLSLPDAALREMAASELPFSATFHLVEDFQRLSADHFLLETSIRNRYRDKWAVCQTTKIIILGSRGAMIIPFSIPGCVSDIGLMLNDVYLSGKEHDLSAFGVDFDTYRKIVLDIKDKSVKIAVDGNTVYTGGYHEALGDFVGIRYRFLGAGEVEYLKIANDRGELILDEDFASPLE